MWLLSTGRAELHSFVSPSDVPGGFAILSHVWDAKEDTFQDLQKIQANCEADGTNPRDFVSPKIRECCKIAERHGHRWAWVDTCCIDKTSSTELSEAINSMFDYYYLAEVCYAYLRDVLNDDDLHTDNSAFRQSRWHQRGWTLQELIAPTLLIFLSQDWSILDTKAELAELLAEITRVPAVVLRHQVPLYNITVAERMSWAANRRTTRTEDIAYCLMGIFSINIPTLYGEGMHAFRRLQEEIMRQSTDMSLFAWGLAISDPTHLQAQDSANGSRHLDCTHTHFAAHSYLFAPSPSYFAMALAFDITPPRLANADVGPQSSKRDAKSFIRRFFEKIIERGQERLAPKYLTVLPTFNVTSYGVHARLPVFRVYNRTIAILDYVVRTPSGGEQIAALILTPCVRDSDPRQPLYHPAFGMDVAGTANGPIMHRVVWLEKKTVNVYVCGRLITPVWEDVYIAHRPPQAVQSTPRVLMNRSLSSPFHFPAWVLWELRKDRLWLQEMEDGGIGTHTPFPWTGSPQLSFTFMFFGRHRSIGEYSFWVTILLGLCSRPTESEAQLSNTTGRRHCAHVTFSDIATGIQSALEDTHICSTDHIDEWPDRTKVFEKRYEPLRHRFTLSFIPSPMNPTETLVVHLKHEVIDND